MSDAILFEESFSVTGVNAEKYDRCSRITGISVSNKECMMTLDVNTELYPFSTGDTFTMLLASTLRLDGTKDDANTWRQVQKGEESTLADNYGYVCYGKVYRFEEGTEDQMKAYVSFGGLLLYLEAPYKRLNALKIEHIYLLLRKT